MITCPKCNYEIYGNETRCPKCGTVIDTQIEERTSETKGTAEMKENANFIENNSQTVAICKNKTKNNIYVAIWVLIAMIAVATVVVAIVLDGKGNSKSSKKSSISHEDCVFIGGYADPNRELTGNTKLSREPKEGYRPVYVRPDDYQSYHFH